MDKKPTNSEFEPDKLAQLWNIGSEDSINQSFPDIQNYKIIETLGEGGMGIIYLAEQLKPIKRQVALKVIKPGMDSKQVLARFEAERQTLALLEHPNIAHIYDAGITDHGLPFFVMEYIDGLSITTYCDKEKLTINDRLKLFTHVCHAIHHAHQKGIIHRDIKPSNILVTIQDDKPVPKVIDFGIAKAISQNLTEQTIFTEHGQLIGTPEYMSPEQAELSSQDIDTRSDIYSLGILLYELLTGSLPFDTKTLRKAAFAEIQRIIREQEPPRPSTRLSNLGDDTKDIVQNRSTELSSLVKRLHRELEWIPLMAIRKDRDQRYKTASDLAEDVQNYLNGNPLVAGPESVAYRVKHLARRHRSRVFITIFISMAIALIVVITNSMIPKVRKEITLFSEDWDNGIDIEKWHIYGSPKPYLYKTSIAKGKASLANNGDNNFPSGVVSVETFTLCPNMKISFYSNIHAEGSNNRNFNQHNDVWFTYSPLMLFNDEQSGTVLSLPFIRHHGGHKNETDQSGHTLYYGGKTLYYADGKFLEQQQLYLPVDSEPDFGEWVKFEMLMLSDGSIEYYKNGELIYHTQAEEIDYTLTEAVHLVISGKSSGSILLIDDIEISLIE